jgi:Na+-driven multidrug efflux pump
MFGAALATSISYFMCFLLFCGFVYKSELRLKVRHFILHLPIIKEITALSFVTFSRQGVVSILAIILNHTLYSTGRTFHRRLRIISRMLMFALFSESHKGLFQLLVIITELKIMKGQGKYPNFYQICSAVSITNFVLYFTMQRLLYPFYYRSKVIAETPDALRWVFAASPIIAIH